MKRLLAVFLLISVFAFAVFADDPDNELLDELVVEAVAESLTQSNPEAETEAPAQTTPAHTSDMKITEKNISDGELVDDDDYDMLEIFHEKDFFAIEELPDIGRPHVALVLSGGGAKGIAHIPIIEALEKHGIPIDKVYGTSMGALIGGLYCAGLSPREMINVVKGTDLMNLFTVFDTTGYKEVLDAFDFNSNNIISVSLGQGVGGVSGLIDDYQVLNFLQKCIGNVPDYADFDKDLVVPFECNATDMLSGDEVIFRSGSLLTAMRSSMSLPLVFEPVQPEENMVLMDGGMVSNYIVHRAVLEGYDIIIVVTLNGYEKNKLTPENYTSISGVAGSTLSVILRNVSRGEVDMADYWFSPDLTGYGTLSFNSVDGILQRGYDEVEQQEAKFQEIANLFTEEQKVYKDPDRVSEYYQKFPQRSRAEHFASSESRHEDFMGRTRVSIGLYGSGGYGFYFNDPSEFTRRVLFPTLSARAFIKDLYGSSFSLDIRLKTTLYKTTDLSAMALYRFTEDTGQRIYGLARIKGSVGSLTSLTDRTQPLSLRVIEGKVTTDFGAMITNEYNYTFQSYLSLENSWCSANIGDDDFYGFIPSLSVETIFYPNYERGFFSMEGGRADFIGTIGYNIKQQELMYKIGIAGENTMRMSDRFSIWFDFTAFTSKGLQLLRTTYETYGGWDGMPGYASDVLVADFITGGFGVQWNLTRGFASSFVTAVVRGGVRSDMMYGLNYIMSDFDSWVPFKDSFTSKIWDLGISVGYGFHTAIGDLIFGVGFNKDLQLALYLELK